MSPFARLAVCHATRGWFGWFSPIRHLPLWREPRKRCARALLESGARRECKVTFDPRRYHSVVSKNGLDHVLLGPD